MSINLQTAGGSQAPATPEQLDQIRAGIGAAREPVDITPAEQASPTPEQLADLHVVYVLTVAPFTRYRSNGSELVEQSEHGHQHAEGDIAGLTATIEALTDAASTALTAASAAQTAAGTAATDASDAVLAAASAGEAAAAAAVSASSAQAQAAALTALPLILTAPNAALPTARTLEVGARLSLVDDGAGQGAVLNSRIDVATGWLAPQYVVPAVLPTGASLTWNALTRNNMRVELTEDAVLENPTGLSDGMVLRLVIKQDATGGWDLTFGDKFAWVGGVAPALPAAPGARSLLTFYFDGDGDILIGEALCDVAAP